MLNEQRRRMLLFPHDTVRPIQDELVIAVDECVQAKKHLVVHAPTGLGKTAATIGPSVAYAIENDLTVFFLTSRHTQHKIALDTVRAIEERYDTKVPVANLIGKKWMCLHSGVENMYSGEFIDYCRKLREDGACEFYENLKVSGSLSSDARVAVEKAKERPGSSALKEIGREHRVCPYEIGVLAAREARVIVTDYFYLFHPMIRESFLKKIGKELDEAVIIVDEAHNLPDRVKDLSTSKVSLFVAERAIDEAEKYGYEFDVLPALRAALQALSTKASGDGECYVKKQELHDALGVEYDAKELLRVGDEIREEHKRSYIGSVGEFLLMWDSSDEGFARILSVRENGASLSYRCLDPGVVSGPLFRECHNAVLMSGTLNPTVMYSELLDLPLNTQEYTFQSPFPAENRLPLIVARTTTKYKSRSDSMFREQAAVLSDIVDATPGNSIVFFPSYALRDKVNAYFSQRTKKPVFLEERGMGKFERQELLDRFGGYKDTGAVLLGVASGSFAEGVDFPGDLLKTVVVVGLPLARPDLETKALMQYYDEKFSRGWDYGYLFPAFNKVLQSAGRCIRSETDRGALVFLDERYAWNNYQRCFPRTWQMRVTQDPKAEIEQFFASGGSGSSKKQNTLF